MSTRFMVRAFAAALAANAVASVGCNNGCNPNPIHGNLEVLSNSAIDFSTVTGFDQSFFSSDNALGTAPLITISTNTMVVRYSDDFSNFNNPNACSDAGAPGSCAPIGSSQEEVVVLNHRSQLSSTWRFAEITNG